VRAVVLDSFALLAFLRDEDGGPKVRKLLDAAGEAGEPTRMTEVNYAEVKYITVRKDGRTRWEEVAALLPALPIVFHPVTRTLSDSAADLKAAHSISLGDAFAAALAREQDLALVTGDREFKALERIIRVRWL
jgi:predicted nucleic acid-binding protein